MTEWNGNQQRMTNYELAIWMQKKPGRQVRYNESEYCVIYSHYDYCLLEENDIVPPEIKVREDKGEWIEPLVV